MPKIVCTMGAVGSGKSSLSNAFAASHDCKVIAFADVLKRVAKEEGGWDGVKDERGRAFIQNFSEEYKRKHGDDIFTRLAFEEALSANNEYVILEDTRFNIEIARALNLRKCGAPLTLFLVHNEAAEHNWAKAYGRYIRGDENCKWAGHRSELEWRAFRSVWTNPLVYKNDFDAGTKYIDSRAYAEFIYNALNNKLYTYSF